MYERCFLLLSLLTRTVSLLARCLLLPDSLEFISKAFSDIGSDVVRVAFELVADLLEDSVAFGTVFIVVGFLQ